jgi:hypothetical protein
MGCVRFKLGNIFKTQQRTAELKRADRLYSCKVDSVAYQSVKMEIYCVSRAYVVFTEPRELAVIQF